MVGSLEFGNAVMRRLHPARCADRHGSDGQPDQRGLHAGRDRQRDAGQLHRLVQQWRCKRIRHRNCFADRGDRAEP